jgi:hypothetical protein
MDKAIRGHTVDTSAREKDASTFLRKINENVLGVTKGSGRSAEPQTFSPPKQENALALARALCMLANYGQAAHRADTDEDRARFDRWRAAGAALLKESAGPLGITVTDALFDRLAAPAEARQQAADLTGSVPVPAEYSVQMACQRLADQLDRLMVGSRFVLAQSNTFWTRLDRATGQIERQPLAPLGRYENVFVRVLEHPGIDKRRFARCANEKCLAFFYRPRLSSRACSRRCENALLAREHYWLEAGRRESALTLRAQGRTLFEIARALGVGLSRAREYLSGKH